MVEFDLVPQLFWNRNEQPVSIDDVMLFVDGEDDLIYERFAGMQFLPSYFARAEFKLALNIDSDKASERLNFLNSDQFKFRKNDESNIKNCYKTGKSFIRLAFNLFELLQNPSEHSVTIDTLKRFFSDIEHQPNGLAEITFAVNIPSCDYLQFVSDGCDKIIEEPFWWDCNLHPLGEDSERDDLVGWIFSTNGAQLQFTSRVPDNENGYRSFLNQLLIVILDIHLHDVQVATYGIGKYSLVSKCALSSLWVMLREELEGGRAGVCRVCGKPFIAHNERKEKARYCKSKGGCQRAFMRTKKVLALIGEGLSVDDAVLQVDGIRRSRFLEIVARNRYYLESEFATVDFDSLLND